MTQTTSIVVVEDEPSVLEMLREVLQAQGFSVIAVPYPELAHTIESDVHPAVFLLDMMLPGISGIELAAQLRKSGFPHTPMIAMSASPLLLEVANGSALFEATLAKPFDLSKLIDCVTRYAA